MKKNLKSIKSGDKKSNLLTVGFSSLIVNGGNKLVVLLTGVLLVRLLGKSEYGIYSYMLSLMSIMLFPIEFGVSNLIVRETARGVTQNDFSEVKGVWRWSFRTSFLYSIVILIISLIGYMFGKKYIDRLEIYTFLWSMIIIPFQAIISISGAALRGLKKVILGQLANLIVIPSLFAISMLLLHGLTAIKLTSSSAMALRLTATLTTFFFIIFYLYKKIPLEVRRASPNHSGKAWFASSMSLGMSGGFSVLKMQMSILILGIFVSSGQIGTYQVAISAAALAGLALQAVSTILAPQFASLIAQGDMGQFQKLVQTSSRIVSSFNLFVTLVFIFWGKFLLQFVFGPEVIDAYPSLIVLLLGQLVNSFTGPVAYILNMAGFEKNVMKIVALSTLINIILIFIITPFWGIIGAAIASSVAMIVSQFTMHKLVYKKLGIVSNTFGKIFH